MTTRTWIFTVWVMQPLEPTPQWGRRVWRLNARTDQPNHEDLKAYVTQQLQRVHGPALDVSFGPIGLAKEQVR